jgi:hypothetical protein
MKLSAESPLRVISIRSYKFGCAEVFLPALVLEREMGRKLPPPTGQILYDAADEPIGYQSQYGIHRSDVFLDSQAAPSKPLKAIIDKLNRLAAEARKELASAGEQSDAQVIAAQTDPVLASAALLNWVTEVAARSLNADAGHLSRRVMAARFLAALHGLQMPPPQMTGVDAAEVAVATRLAAAGVFADAWHFWHMEVYGEHASAFMDHLAAQGRIKASATQQTNKKKRDAIIIGQIADVVDDEKQPPRALARNRLRRFTAALHAGNLDKMTEGALAKAIERIRKARKAGQAIG